ncbi:transglycosylase domain-containing protein, partial [Lactobacillus acetotolerans]
MANNNFDSNHESMKRESRKDYQEKQPKKHLWTRIVKWSLLIVLLLIVSGIGLFAFYAKSAPSISQNQLQSGGTSSLYNDNGKFLLSLGSEKRIYVRGNKIPQRLKDAVVSVEDKRFYKDKLGIDPIRIIGSTLTNAKSNSI